MAKYKRKPEPGPITTGPYVRLWREWLSRNRRLYILGLGLMILTAGATAAYAKLMQMIVHAFENGQYSVMYWGPLAVIGLTVISASTDYMRETTVQRAVIRTETDLQKAMFARLVGADLAHLRTEAPAGLAARFSSDIGLVSRSVKSLMGGITNVLTMVGAFGMMLTIDWPLTLAMFGVFLVALFPVIIIGQRLRRVSRRTQNQIASMTSTVTEGLSGIRMARTYQLEEPMAESAGLVFEGLFGLKVKANKWQARLSPLMEMLGAVAVGILLFVVGMRMSAGTITLADFTGLLTGLGVAVSPARRLGSTYAAVATGGAALDRIFMLFDSQNSIVDGPRTMGRTIGLITYESVDFAYPDGHVALEDFEMRVQPGSRVALVGRSGAGKSTVFNLLPRLYDPVDGRICLDGIDIRELTLESLRNQIAVVSQDSVLLTGTVAQNIGFGRRGATREDIVAAAEAAAADGFIRALPKGYDTMIIPSEASFSGGERQRLSIARAILRDAPILLLDEPTSALDAESEAMIRTALDRLSHGRTTLVIAHRLTTILDADSIVVMDRGRIVEQGTHAELLVHGGLYADLYRLQFAGAEV
ncbi:ABC transporter ATP-binding protein [Amaricoccus sp.]|uniref:ABC transporter ATP-binding protein n=1 Tax=Amaricoccus sp. TaxID=1872485 RepID=UPI001B580695|nr:ABC transporter ATP-binding protein [Amaricoccus sp.]MBP7000843.1 ABC transporter ATP-binding protein [Amaricoccus sp.]